MAELEDVVRYVVVQLPEGKPARVRSHLHKSIGTAKCKRTQYFKGDAKIFAIWFPSRGWGKPEIHVALHEGEG